MTNDRNRSVGTKVFNDDIKVVNEAPPIERLRGVIATRAMAAIVKSPDGPSSDVRCEAAVAPTVKPCGV
jgi:hypothetical protein